MTLNSPSKRSPERCATLAGGPPLVRFAAPLRRHGRGVCAFPGASSLRPDAARRPTRSALAVSHRLDGSHHTPVRGFVAPRCRSGVRRVSGAFRSRSRPKTVADLRAPSPRRGFTPSEEFPSSAAGTASLRPVAFLSFRACPLRRGRGRTAEVPGEPGIAGLPPAEAGGSSLTQTVVPSSGDAPVPPGEPGWTPTSPRLHTLRRRADAAMSTDRLLAAPPRRNHPNRSIPYEAASPARREEAGHTNRRPEAPIASRPPAETGDHSPHARTAVPTREPTDTVRADPSRTTRAADFKALLRRRVRCVRWPLPTTRHPILPWALFPSKVSYPPPPQPDRMPGLGRAPGRSPRWPAPSPRRPKPTRSRQPLSIPPAIPPEHRAEALPRRVGGWSGRAVPGAEADRERRAFSAVRPQPGSAPRALGAAEATFVRGAGSPESVRRRIE